MYWQMTSGPRGAIFTIKLSTAADADCTICNIVADNHNVYSVSFQTCLLTMFPGDWFLVHLIYLKRHLRLFNDKVVLHKCSIFSIFVTIQKMRIIFFFYLIPNFIFCSRLKDNKKETSILQKGNQ